MQGFMVELIVYFMWLYRQSSVMYNLIFEYIRVLVHDSSFFWIDAVWDLRRCVKVKISSNTCWSFSGQWQKRLEGLVVFWLLSFVFLYKTDSFTDREISCFSWKELAVPAPRDSRNTCALLDMVERRSRTTCTRTIRRPYLHMISALPEKLLYKLS